MVSTTRRVVGSRLRPCVLASVLRLLLLCTVALDETETWSDCQYVLWVGRVRMCVAATLNLHRSVLGIATDKRKLSGCLPIFYNGYYKLNYVVTSQCVLFIRNKWNIYSCLSNICKWVWCVLSEARVHFAGYITRMTIVLLKTYYTKCGKELAVFYCSRQVLLSHRREKFLISGTLTYHY